MTMLRVESRPLLLVSPEIELTSNAPTGCIDHPEELPAGMTSTVESTLNVLPWTAQAPRSVPGSGGVVSLPFATVARVPVDRIEQCALETDSRRAFAEPALPD
ncbi:hypothetical protein [Curtobacterium aurantiacum]|uniref:hypothetical protein n=1 Tax=Curtobacterium aurantiacum TaxID=3236919 RepID=UPI001BE092F5|nr:hypothetical protein [Curtobacterium flaccumfaciens]MBT1676136.1 hypothetical protein [Curtobacterium flaccumfaciens pv. flaccumfaciens]